MNICNFCGEPVRYFDGCKGKYFRINGKVYERIVYSLEASKKCPDCSCQPGMYHHVGCTEELCPVCNNKRVECQCGK